MPHWLKEIYNESTSICVDFEKYLKCFVDHAQSDCEKKPIPM